ncbi:hypothetical protein L208DRAFT_185831 [Tricholoma matsutake]|nr:hypothetical protein L208DRAFT_185831 [Tricholoma matsutake 945]
MTHSALSVVESDLCMTSNGLRLSSTLTVCSVTSVPTLGAWIGGRCRYKGRIRGSLSFEKRME